MKKVILPAKRLDGTEKQWLSRNKEKNFIVYRKIL